METGSLSKLSLSPSSRCTASIWIETNRLEGGRTGQDSQVKAVECRGSEEEKEEFEDGVF